MVFRNRKILRNVIDGIYGDVKKDLRELEGKVELGLKVLTSKDTEIDEDSFASDIRALPEIAYRAQKDRRFSDCLLVNASYLVSKEKVDQFSEAVEELGEKYPQLDFQYSGPWAPFSLVSLKVGGEK